MNLENIIESVSMIYASIQDEKSRRIFNDRLMYSLTYGYNYIADMSISDDMPMKWLETEIQKCYTDKHPLILDGAGYWGKSIRNTLPEYNWVCFCDKNPTDEKLLGLPVYTREEAVQKYPEGIFVVTPINVSKAIKKELESYEIANIIDFGSYLNNTYMFDDRQYFDVFKFTENEIIADVGCYDCDSMFKYFQYGNKKYEHIYSFEPEREQFENCQKIIADSGLSNWDISNYGAYDVNTEVNFSNGGSGSSIVSKGEYTINVIRLDDYFENRKIPTFIKMDIEGAELKALQGAAKIIRKHKPKLAICVYHKPEDIITIPSYLLELNPNYQFYLRHYTNRLNETVLYAIDKHEKDVCI